MTGQLRAIATEHSTEGARALARMNHPRSGVLVTAAVPDLRRRYELGWDILVSLGKRDHVIGSGRNDDSNWQAIPSWFAAHEITDLVILDAQWLPKTLIADVASLAARTGVDVWLVAHHPIEPAYAKAVRAHDAVPAEPGELVAVLAKVEALPEWLWLRYPTVPYDTFPTFLATCRRRLTEKGFRQIKRTYDLAFANAKDFFGSMNRTGTPDSQERAVLRKIRERFDRCGSTDEMLVVLRAMQAAALRCGWLVNADLARLVITADEAPWQIARGPEIWQRLAAYRDPYRGAVCALAASDIAINEMTELRCRDISFEGNLVTVQRDGGSVTVEIHEFAAVYLRAQLAVRASHGASSDHLFFADAKRPYRARHLSNALRAPVLEVGVPLISQATSWTRTDGRRWATRWGLSVQALA